MNRKEMIVVGILLLLSFATGGFAAPAVQQVFITNLPVDSEGNLRIVTQRVEPKQIVLADHADITISQDPGGFWPSGVMTFAGVLGDTTIGAQAYLTYVSDSSAGSLVDLSVSFVSGSISLSSFAFPRLFPDPIRRTNTATEFMGPSLGPDLLVLLQIRGCDGCPSSITLTVTAWLYIK